MKKTGLIIILLSLGLKGMAQTNNLIVFDQQGEQFWAILNGVKQNVNPQTNVKITGLNANTYKLKLLFKDSTKGMLDKTIFYNTMGTEETYNVVVKNNGERTIRYVSMVPLAQAAPVDPNQTVVNYGVTPPPDQGMGNNSTTVVQQTTTTTNPNTTGVNMNMGGMNVGMNVTGMDGATTQQTTVTTTTTTSSTGDGYNNQQGYNQPPPPPVQRQQYVDGYNGPAGCPMPMNHDDYESAKRSIAAKDFENTKLDMAKQITTSNCLTAGQVRGIMQLFTFENSKLEYAKFAYSHTYDKSNYFKVNDAFQFDSSASDLSNYIAGH